MSYRASAAPVDRMSFVSKGSLNENGMQYIGSFPKSGLRPYCASSSEARSSASGCFRNSSHTGGAPAGSGPLDGCRSTIVLTRHRPFTAEVERGQRVHFAGIRRADGHAVLLLHLRIRGGRFHAAELDRRSGVPIEVGQERRDPNRLSRELDRLAGADGTTRRGGGVAVAGE